MKILITGGHVTPALAVVDELKGHDIVFVGRKYALEQEQTLSLEYKEVVARGLPFLNLSAGRINRNLSLGSFASFLKIPYGFYQAHEIVKKVKPDVVLTFGSYLAAPIAWWAHFYRIPVFLHEQTSIPGKANRFIAKFAKKVFISFPETEEFFPKDKVVLTGNPVRPSVSKIIRKPFTVEKDRPVIYVTGGSLGSHSINLHIEKLLAPLLAKFTVIHQVGDTKQYNDFEKLETLRQALDHDKKKRYFLKKHFLEDEIGYVYHSCDLVVGRAGANTFFELILLEKPAIFIPLPWSGEKEQEKQATIFKTAGVGEIFQQSEDNKILEAKIYEVLGDLERYKKNFSNLRKLYKDNAAKTIASEILKRT